MSRPLSVDLRARVVAAHAGDESARAVAARSGVAVSSVVKWSQRYRATGFVAPGKMGGQCGVAVPATRGIAVQKNAVRR
jgi:transposase